jgi:hypothetical protein
MAAQSRQADRFDVKGLSHRMTENGRDWSKFIPLYLHRLVSGTPDHETSTRLWTSGQRSCIQGSGAQEYIDELDADATKFEDGGESIGA